VSAQQRPKYTEREAINYIIRGDETVPVRIIGGNVTFQGDFTLGGPITVFPFDTNGNELSPYIKNVDVPLSTRASEATLSAILSRLPVNGFSSFSQPLDIIINLIQTTSPTVFMDHISMEVSLNENQIAINLPKKAQILRLTAVDAPVYVNLDREIAGSDYIAIPANTHCHSQSHEQDLCEDFNWLYR